MDGVPDLRDHNSIGDTANLAGHHTTQLTQAARDLTEAAAVTDLFMRLLEAETGTNSIESQALSLAKERNVKEGKGSLNVSRDTARDPEVVVDLLEVRLKYVKRAETAARKVYHTQLGVVRRAAGGWQIFSKIVGKVRKEQQELWRSLVRKNLKKVTHLIKKHRSDGGIVVSEVNTNAVSLGIGMGIGNLDL